MSACLVGQLFRQKIGLSIDDNLVSENIWPHLFTEKHLPSMVLQDIHLVRQANPDGLEEDRQSFIREALDVYRPYGAHDRNIRSLRPHVSIVKNVSRRRALQNLSTVDIVNKIRTLHNPVILPASTVNKPNRPFSETCIRLVERTYNSFMSRSGSLQKMDPMEAAIYLREQQNLDKQRLHDFFDEIIRLNATLMWSISGSISNPIAILSLDVWIHQ